MIGSFHQRIVIALSLFVVVCLCYDPMASDHLADALEEPLYVYLVIMI